jgi:recombination protein RecA
MSRRKAVEDQPSAKNEIFKKISEVCEAINKQFPPRQGEYTISYMGSKQVSRIPTFSSGSLALDVALGGGYPWGRIVEIFGPESGGKTTLVLHAIANAQKAFPEEMVAFIDAEHSLDLYYARNLGVDVSTLLVTQPDTGEQALEITLDLVKRGVKLIVIDSVAALVPKAMIEQIEGGQIGAHASLMSKGIRTFIFLATTRRSCLPTRSEVRSEAWVTPQ